jgi:hypothetical protein
MTLDGILLYFVAATTIRQLLQVLLKEIGVRKGQRKWVTDELIYR